MISSDVIDLAKRFWRVVAPIVQGFAICWAVAYVWFGFVSISVKNESGRDIQKVTLQRFSFEEGEKITWIDGKVIWTEDLDRDEGEWRYTYPGDYGVVLRFEQNANELRSECPYDSAGIALSVEFVIKSDGTVSCWSGVREPR